MADNLQENLWRADSVLAALVENPQALDSARDRFSRSPPPYTSQLSHSSTRSPSLITPNEEQRLAREGRKWQLIEEHRASNPASQFNDEEREELDWLWERDLVRTSHHLPPIGNLEELAADNVKKRWVEQGIWNVKWPTLPMWKWRHQEEFEPEVAPPPEPARHSIFGFSVNKPVATTSTPLESAEELPSVKEQRLVWERQCEASRPFQRFIYQLSTERERIDQELNTPPPPVPDLDWIFSQERLRVNDTWVSVSQARAEAEAKLATKTKPLPPDANSKAYERVKTRWMDRGIWNTKWGLLPGMCWKNEKPLQEFVRDEMDPEPEPEPESVPAPARASPLGDNGYDAGHVQTRPFSLFGVTTYPTAESCAEPSAIPDAAQHGSVANMNSDAPERNSEEPPDMGVELFSSPSTVESGHEPEPPSTDTGRTPEIRLTPLSPVHSTDVPKAPAERRESHRLQQKTNGSVRELSVPDPSVPTAPLPRRRSGRLQEAKRVVVAPEPSATVNAHPRTRGSQSTPRRTNSAPRPTRAAKPQGVTKTRPSNSRRRARYGAGWHD